MKGERQQNLKKFKLINLKNKYYKKSTKPSIAKFRRKYRYHGSGYKLWINKLDIEH